MDQSRMPEHEHLLICSGLPHPFICTMTFWCPHQQRWGGWVDLGESSDAVDMIDVKELPIGPFDTVDDIAEMYRSLITRSVLLDLRERRY